MNQVELVNDFLEVVIEAIAQKVYEDSDVDAELILSQVSSPMLLDIYRLYKNGASKQLIIESFQEEIQVHTAILETLKGMLTHATDLLEQDDNHYQTNKTNA